MSLKRLHTRESAIRSVEDAYVGSYQISKVQEVEHKTCRAVLAMGKINNSGRLLTCLNISFCVSAGRSRIVTFDFLDSAKSTKCSSTCIEGDSISNM